MKLWDYQEEAVAFIHKRKRAYLALDMGMGKTLTSLAAAHRAGRKHVLLVAEKNEVVNSRNFEREVGHFPDLEYVSLRDEDLETVSLSTERLVCGINPDALAKHDPKVIAMLFDTMIVDESTNIKNVSTKRFKNVHKIAKQMQYLALLSGTPMMNGAAELYAPLLLLDHHMVLGKGKAAREAFETVFAGGHYRKIRNTGVYWKDYAWWAGGANHVRVLRYLLDDLFFFKRKDDTGVFRDKARSIRWVPMSFPWIAEYTKAWDEYYAEQKLRRTRVELSNINELRRLIENGQMYQVNSRWKARQLVEDLKAKRYGDQRIVVFSMFIETDALIQELLTEAGIGFKTFDDIADWKAGDEQVLVGRIKAHGKGGNVPEASVCLFVDMDFVPANNIQAENRIDRPEQKNDMTIVYYMTQGDDVIDTHVRNINRDKARVIRNFMAPLAEGEEKEIFADMGALRERYPKEMNILGI